MLGCQRTERGARHCRVPPRHLKPSVQTCTFRLWINPGQHCANSRGLLPTYHYSFNSGADRSATITCRTHWRPCATNWPDWSQLVIAGQHLGMESRTISLQPRKSCYPWNWWHLGLPWMLMPSVLSCYTLPPHVDQLEGYFISLHLCLWTSETRATTCIIGMKKVPHQYWLKLAFRGDLNTSSPPAESSSELWG